MSARHKQNKARLSTTHATGSDRMPFYSSNASALERRLRFWCNCSLNFFFTARSFERHWQSECAHQHEFPIEFDHAVVLATVIGRNQSASFCRTSRAFDLSSRAHTHSRTPVVDCTFTTGKYRSARANSNLKPLTAIDRGNGPPTGPLADQRVAKLHLPNYSQTTAVTFICVVASE